MINAVAYAIVIVPLVLLVVSRFDFVYMGG